jgi:hypothetical protein
MKLNGLNNWPHERGPQLRRPYLLDRDLRNVAITNNSLKISQQMKAE